MILESQIGLLNRRAKHLFYLIYRLLIGQQISRHFLFSKAVLLLLIPFLFLFLLSQKL
jgi:ABC-type maltose transport system permease subunit